MTPELLEMIEKIASPRSSADKAQASISAAVKNKDGILESPKPKKREVVKKEASVGSQDTYVGADPMQAEAPDEDLSQPMEQAASQIPPELMLKLKQHMEEHKLMRKLGMEDEDEDEQEAEPSVMQEEIPPEVEKEAAKKKIYRYIKGKRRAWYIDDEITKKSSAERIAKLKRTLAELASKGQYSARARQSMIGQKIKHLESKLSKKNPGTINSFIRG